MRLFYTDMKDKLQTDENAFLVEQAKWLGFSEGEITSMLAQSGVERCEFAISSICKIIETDYYHKELNKEQNIEMVRKINAYVRMLLTVQNGFSAEEIRQIKEAVKGDRTFSVDRFNCFISKFNPKMHTFIDAMKTHFLHVLNLVVLLTSSKHVRQCITLLQNG